MRIKSIMFGTLVLLLAVPAVSAANEVYLNPQTVYIPECGNATVQLLLNATDRVDTWSTMIGFDNESVNITEVDFTGGITPTNASWGYHGDYVYLGGVSLDDRTGDRLVLANLTVECVGEGGCTSDLNFTGEVSVERLIAGLPDGNPPHGTIHSAEWVNGTAQGVDCGDVDCDGDVDVDDVIETYKRACNPGYSLNQPWTADVDCDGDIDVDDVIEVYKRACNPGYELHCC